MLKTVFKLFILLTPLLAMNLNASTISQYYKELKKSESKGKAKKKASKKEGQYPKYSLMLVGGGLKTCSSLSPKNCSGAALSEIFSGSVKTERQFKLANDSIVEITNGTIWRSNRQEVKEQVVTLLNYLSNKFNDDVIGQKEFETNWKNAELEVNGVWTSGKDVFFALSETELNFVSDNLEVFVSVDNKGKTRAKEAVNLEFNRNKFTTDIYKKFVDLAAQNSDRNKPKVLVMTSSARDTMEVADFYVEALAAVGGDTEWLPVDAAYQAAQQTLVDGDPSCEQLPNYRADINGAWKREGIYKYWSEKQVKFCEKPKLSIEAIKSADALFINGGDQSLTYKALKTPEGFDTPELKAIKEQVEKGLLIVGGTSAGTAVISGGTFGVSTPPMVTSGNSFNALVNGAFSQEAPHSGCSKDSSCPAGIQERDLTYNENGGLGLFPWGILDTHFSERARHGRLIKLSNETKTRYAFGIDESTALLVGWTRDEKRIVNFEVMGKSGVYVVDNTKSVYDNKSIVGAATHYLTNGDKLVLRNNKLNVVFAPWKFSLNNQQRPLLNSGNIMRGTNYKKIANLLCLTRTSKATGKQSEGNKVVNMNIYKANNSLTRSGAIKVHGSDVNYCSYRNFKVDVKAFL